MNKKKETSIWSAITIAASLFIVLFGLYTEAIDKSQSLIIVFMAAVVLAYVHSGFKMIKYAMSTFIIVYLIAMYNMFSVSITDYIIQPTMLSVATIFAFISSTYRSHLSDERSRPLWVALFTAVLITMKSATLVYSQNLIIAETVGAIITVIAIVIWNIWILKSKKTKITSPTFEDEEYKNFKVILSESLLDTNNILWIDSKNINGLNAKPFLIDSIKKARDNKMNLAVVNKGNDEHYTEVELTTRNGTLKFLYIQTNEGNYKEIIDEYDKKGGM